jgi:hypothetical protein
VYIPLGERELAKELEQRGVEKGKEEMARKFLADGISPEVIAKNAEWPVERVRALIN